VVLLNRFEETDTPGWKSAGVLLKNRAGHSAGLLFGSAHVIAAEFSPGFASRSQRREILSYPCEVRLRNTGGELVVLAAGEEVHRFKQPKGDAWQVPHVMVSRMGGADGVLAEFGPPAIGGEGVAVRPMADTPSPAGVPVPTAGDFPRVVMGTFMFWCGPGSPSFTVGGVPGANVIRGFYGNAPMVRDMGQQLRDLEEAGIDVLVLDFFTGMNVPVVTGRYLDMARESGTGVRMGIMIERPHTKQRWSPDMLKDFWNHKTDDGKPVTQHPNLFTAGPARVPVFITYGTESAHDWRERLRRVRLDGGNAAVIGDTTSIEIAVTDKVPARFVEPIAPLAGAYFFSSVTSALHPEGRGIMPDFLRFVRAFPGDKVAGVSVKPGYISSGRVGNLLSPRGTEVFRRQWMDAITCNPDFVHLTTISDYSENTEQECSSNSTFTFLDMIRYFGHRWREGRWPRLEKPQAFLSYRKSLSGARAASFELVVLDPDLTGEETQEEIQGRLRASLELELDGGRVVGAEVAGVRAHPGHAVVEFSSNGPWEETGFVIPRMPEIVIDGKKLALAEGARLAPVAVLGPGDEESRHWFHIPLHRVRGLGDAALEVRQARGESYPRRLHMSGLPWADLDGVVFERGQNPVHGMVDADEARDGWPEPYYVGPGYNPMRFESGWAKRWVADTTDRYRAVLRFKDGTIGFPRPDVVPAPRLDDPSVVMDPVIAPPMGQDLTKLSDRSPLQRDLLLGEPDAPLRPEIVPVGDRPPWWALRFNDKEIRQGPFSFPPGDATLELWIRPEQTGKPQTLVHSQSAVLNLAIRPGGTIALSRHDEHRRLVTIEGTGKVTPGRWNHVAAVQSGDDLILFLNGKRDGHATCPGARTDEITCIGRKPDNRSLPEEAAQALGFNRDVTEPFFGDLARYRVFARALSPEEITAAANHMLETLEPDNP